MGRSLSYKPHLDTSTVLQMFMQVLFWAANQGNHKNWVQCMVPHKCVTVLNWDERKNEFWILEFGILWTLFESTKSQIPNSKLLFFLSSPFKSVTNLWGTMDGPQFWWLPWFPAQNNTCVNICNTMHLDNLFKVISRSDESDKFFLKKN